MNAPTPRRLQRTQQPRKPATGNPAASRLPSATEKALAHRAGARCECCGKPLRARNRHHRKLRSQGGSDAVTNLVLICPACHNTIHNNPEWSKEHGWIVVRGHSPARITLLLHGDRRVLLTADGGYRDAA